MTSALTHIAAVTAGLAIITTAFTAGRKGFLPGMTAAVGLAVTAALLITAVRTFG